MMASLPMYWRAENAPAWQRFWQNVQSSVDVPPLTEPDDLPSSWYDHWLDPALTLSQTCGLPFRTKLKGKVAYVTTPDFGIEGCAPGYYRSVVIRRKGDAGGLRLARNAGDSQSGWAAACDWRDQNGQGEWETVTDTGAHFASAMAVAEGTADIAFLDVVTWRLIQHQNKLSERVEIVDQTRPTPGLPLVASLQAETEALKDALNSALHATAEADKAAMGGLRGFVDIDPAHYFDVPVPTSI